MKKRTISEFEFDPEQKDAIDNRVDEKLAAVQRVYSLTPETFSATVPNGSKILKYLRDRKTVHKVHPEVRKTEIVLPFEFCPAEMSTENRAQIKLVDVLERIEPSASETPNVTNLPPRDHYGGTLVPHFLQVTEVYSDAPFGIAFTTNMHDATLAYRNARQRWMSVDAENQEIVMPKNPSMDTSLIAFDPKMKGVLSTNLGLCMKPFEGLFSDSTRALGSISEAELKNGVADISSWKGPREEEYQPYVAMPSNHIVVQYAHFNFLELNLAFSASERKESQQGYVVMMSRKLFFELCEKLIKSSKNHLPRYSIPDVVFEIFRYVGKGDWGSREDVLEEERDTFMNKTYHCEIKLAFSYTLFVRAKHSGYPTQPGIDLPLYMDNEEELFKYIRNQAEDSVQAEEMRMSFEQMKMGTGGIDDADGV